ncbi:hypothetical protein CEXT_22091 [Caerostris extrusa]|uniref:Uncharacterized protein n=1 Tax=Caerostris extrusa TaxID=172846 RepID=A0AAV4MXJ2_CAEEX|nr:hypothetical protein CEXT_22091 [Caerostris extrusa]
MKGVMSVRKGKQLLKLGSRIANDLVKLPSSMGSYPNVGQVMKFVTMVKSPEKTFSKRKLRLQWPVAIFPLVKEMSS